jgi:YVTN family beta-propeller protein
VFGTGKVDVIDTLTFAISGQVSVADGHGVALSPDGGTAYVGSQVPDHNAIVVLDVPGRRITARVPLAQAPRGLFLSPDGKSLYFTVANSATVEVLDRATKGITTQIPVGPIPHQMAFTPDHRFALVVVQGTGQVAVIDLPSHQVVKDIVVGKFPHWVALTSDGALAYVTNEGDDTVSVVNVASQKVIATLPVGSEPRKIALQQGAGAMSAYEAPATVNAAGFAAQAVRPAPVPMTGDVRIRIRAFAYTPATVTVAVGHKVTWINDDPVPHTATAQTTHGKLWDVGQVVPGASMTVTMTKPGTYVYQCDDHPFMQAKLIVIR